MKMFSGITNFFSSRGKAQALYERGMKKAKHDDFEGAIEDYTAALQMAKLPEDMRAMTLFNRGLAWAGIKEYDKARTDLQQVLALKAVPANIASAAREKIERMKRREKNEAE